MRATVLWQGEGFSQLLADQAQKVLAHATSLSGGVHDHPGQLRLVFFYQGDSHALAIEVSGEQPPLPVSDRIRQFLPVLRGITQYLGKGLTLGLGKGMGFYADGHRRSPLVSFCWGAYNSRSNAWEV